MAKCVQGGKKTFIISILTVRYGYLTSRKRADSLHHSKSSQMLQKGNSLSESGVQLNLDSQSEHGTTQRAEPGIPASTYSRKHKKQTGRHKVIIIASCKHLCNSNFNVHLRYILYECLCHYTVVTRPFPWLCRVATTIKPTSFGKCTVNLKGDRN